MTTEDQNVALVKALYASWHETKGDPRPFLDHTAEDATLHSLSGGAPGVEFTRRCRSKAEIEHYFSTLLRDFAMNHFTVDEVIANEDRVVVLCRTSWTSRLTGKTFETPKVDVLRVVGGKISEYAEYYDTARVEAAARP